MADLKRVERPLSPHLQIYRIQLTSVTSILTRITGNALIVGVALVVWWLFAAAVSPAYFAVANAVIDHFNNDDLIGAYEEYIGITDGDEKSALWGMFPSNIRTAPTKHNKLIEQQKAAA